MSAIAASAARCTLLQIRLTLAEKRAYARAAEAAGLDVSTWARQMLARAVGLPRL